MNLDEFLDALEKSSSIYVQAYLAKNLELYVKVDKKHFAKILTGFISRLEGQKLNAKLGVDGDIYIN